MKNLSSIMVLIYGLILFLIASCSFRTAPELRYDYGELIRIDTVRHENFPTEYYGYFKDSRRIDWPIQIPDSMLWKFKVGQFYVITPRR